MGDNLRKSIKGYVWILVFVISACGQAVVEPTPTVTSIPPTDTPEPTSTPISLTSTVEAPTPDENAAYEQAAQYEGEWVGTWTNTTFGSTGDVTVTIIVGTDGTAIFLVDLGGLVFGVLDPPEMRYEGTYTADGAVFEAPGDPVFGDLTITVDSDGLVEIVGDLIPVEGIARLEATGTISVESMDLQYVVNFAGGGQAVGVMTLTRP